MTSLHYNNGTTYLYSMILMSDAIKGGGQAIWGVHVHVHAHEHD